MSVLTTTKEPKSKVHFSEYIVTSKSQTEEPKPAEDSENSGDDKPVSPGSSQ